MMKNIWSVWVGCMLGVFLAQAHAHAYVEYQESKTYYLDPIAGHRNNDGSASAPWPSLEEVISTGKVLQDGDELILLSGPHGKPYFSNYQFDTNLKIVAAPDATPWVSGLQLANSHHLTIDGLLVDGTSRTDSNPNWVFLITGDVNTHHITLTNCTIKSAEDVSTWTRADWYAKAFGGMDFRGTDITVSHSTITNVYHAVSLRGNGTYFHDNVIDNFGADALQVRGSNSTYENNLIRDAYIEDYEVNHDDALQFFSLASDPIIENVVIRNNKFLLFEDEITPFMEAQKTAGQPVVSEKMQAIIITDGYSDGWIVENNLVVNANAHGISLYGARNCRVQNNTVVHHPNTTYFSNTTNPQVLVTDQTKTGQTNFSNVIRNNLSTNLSWSSFDATSTVEGNIDIDQSNEANYLTYFKDYLGHDFHLKVGSPAVDAGINKDLPATDLDGRARLNSSTVDVGAYELDQDGSSNLAPEMGLIAPQKVRAGEATQVNISASDADGDLLSFTIHEAPDFVTLTDHQDGTAQLVISSLPGDEGSYTFEVVVSDGQATDEQVVSLTVTDGSGEVLALAVESEASRIYPNPSKTGEVYLNLGTSQLLSVQLSDMMGREVEAHLSVVPMGLGVVRISPLSQLKNQQYILRIQFADQFVNQILIVN
ncbi:right-handed parallel beta-helix repeat-containing protein [Reichenbachiella carrageenanivorans]|uniref:Right-handed parallel beta-helix repeat-containing protein n=1 Tax=Reichenbachiella carrageenanivorans TaxID=2979869 RepID=A0ABY6D152_9BACT|nr:right-handed parallel beta-helix repeat-containing protein [Reichenbachiella carrageenanivorans]UXX79906.1 right-handed parallel beta-helix repeat-containing protein [Reichenbachiella carrageenanivorans]